MDNATSIKELRQKCLLSQEEFAKELGVSFATVNRWENGKAEPSYKAKRGIEAFCHERGLTYKFEENR